MESRVNQIVEVVNERVETAVKTTIAYEDGRTTLTDHDGRKVYIYFDKNNFPLLEIDEGGFNAVSGALSVLGGVLGGYAGVHNTIFTKLLSQKGDFFARLLIENMFTIGFKIANSFFKPYFII